MKKIYEFFYVMSNITFVEVLIIVAIICIISAIVIPTLLRAAV